MIGRQANLLASQVLLHIHALVKNSNHCNSVIDTQPNVRYQPACLQARNDAFIFKAKLTKPSALKKFRADLATERETISL